MANSDIPFTVVESPDFRQLFHMLNESMTSTLLPKGGDTMRTWLNDIYWTGRLRKGDLEGGCFPHSGRKN